MDAHAATDAPRSPGLPHVVIVGAGFAGLHAAKTLKNAPVSITMIDRTNHHLFQPLLYQVATAALNPADVATPIRTILSNQRNAEVVMGEVVGIDPDQRIVRLEDRSVQYDRLILAVGAQTRYFGHTEWRKHAPGLKTVPDALEIRERFLAAFERAELLDHPRAREAELTFVVVGGGPTGVELAGAMSEIARRSMINDFRRIKPSSARIVLLQAGDQLLPAYDKALGERAKSDLEELGVEVILDARVSEIAEDHVSYADQTIMTRNAFWTAGVGPSDLGAYVGETAESGHVLVEPDLSVKGRPEVFVVGDLATLNDPETGEPVPGLAPAAMQMGKHAATIIRREAEAGAEPGSDPKLRAPFRYKDKGSLATIGRNRAVGSIRGMKFTGFLAWFIWLAVHLLFLIGFRNKAIVLLQWAWSYLTFKRGARLIVEEHRQEHARV